jgi:hypothetical protein
MKQKQTMKKLALHKKTVSLLKHNAQKAVQGGTGKTVGTQIPDSPLCPPTVQTYCDPVTFTGIG